MKNFNKLMLSVLFLMVILFFGSNFLFHFSEKKNTGRPYRIEAERIAKIIEKKGVSAVDLKNYTYILHLEEYTEKNKSTFFHSDYDYLIQPVRSGLYRFDYSYTEESHSRNAVFYAVFFIFFSFVFSLLLFLRNHLIKPFEEISEIPYALARGNLTIPLKENKNKFFGKFLWGLDLLREHLEERKRKELELQKEKKTLLLSLSHDLKTPLSVIELSAKALEKGLYQEEKKRQEVAKNIYEKCTEINEYIEKIIQTAHENLLNFEVKNDEFYLSDFIKEIEKFYTEKLDLLKINFSIAPFQNQLLKGDFDRAVEVLQNLIENALKYGDGKEISLHFEREEDCLLLSVKNSGSTLSDSELPHIFESFWRGSNAGTSSGSGLGLYICRELMRKMNGEIFAETENETMSVTAVFPLV